LLLVGPLVAAGAGVVLAVEDVPLHDAMVDVPRLAHQRLAAELAHSQSGLAALISGYAAQISTPNL
jgi:hypothetical protein